VAEPKPASEKPNLIAVPSEPRTGSDAPSAGSTPSPARPAPLPANPQEKKGPPWGLWLLAGLLAVATVVGWVQSERLAQSEARVTALSEQVLGLEAQLSVANTRIHTFEMERGEVREAVSDIAQRVLLLSELVGGPTEPAAAPEAASETTPEPEPAL
jgi:hypothetical protein